MNHFMLWCLVALLLLFIPAKALPAKRSEEDGKTLVHPETLKNIEKLIEHDILLNLQEANLGRDPEYAAESCKQIGELKSDADSGYYWVKRLSEPIGVYCMIDGDDQHDMSGGWMRVAHMDMTECNSECLPGLEYISVEGRRLCRRPREQVPGCASTSLDVHGIAYSKVCGKIVGYQYFNTWAFGANRYNSDGIDGVYLDGISVTYGSPRQHIFSLAAAMDDVLYMRFASGFYHVQCPCFTSNITFTGEMPEFVEEDYYCETGSRGGREVKYYFDDPLWDGKGCGDTNPCCQRGGPWFCKDLNQTVTDNVELRACANCLNGCDDFVIESVELYVQ